MTGVLRSLVLLLIMESTHAGEMEELPLWLVRNEFCAS